MKKALVLNRTWVWQTCKMTLARNQVTDHSEPNSNNNNRDRQKWTALKNLDIWTGLMSRWVRRKRYGSHVKGPAFLFDPTSVGVCVCGVEKNNKFQICISTTLLEANSPRGCHISACLLFQTTFAWISVQEQDSEHTVLGIWAECRILNKGSIPPGKGWASLLVATFKQFGLP